MKNEELIKALRWCGSEDEQHEMCVDESYSCPMWNEDRMTDYCKAGLMLAAADALEAVEHLCELVRCKDCKWWKNAVGWGGVDLKKCELSESVRKPDWFCADGERKENP